MTENPARGVRGQVEQQADQVDLPIRCRLLIDRLQLLAHGVVLHAGLPCYLLGRAPFRDMTGHPAFRRCQVECSREQIRIDKANST